MMMSQYPDPEKLTHFTELMNQLLPVMWFANFCASGILTLIYDKFMRLLATPTPR